MANMDPVQSPSGEIWEKSATFGAFLNSSTMSCGVLLSFMRFILTCIVRNSNIPQQLQNVCTMFNRRIIDKYDGWNMSESYTLRDFTTYKPRCSIQHIQRCFSFIISP